MTETIEVPNDVQSEEAVIGSLLISPDMYYQVSAILQPADFYVHRNAWVFEAISNLVKASIEIDTLTVSSELDRMGKSDYGGPAYLTELVLSSPNSYNAASYARLVKDKAILRGLISMANNVATLAHSSKPIDEILTLSQSEAVKATERGNTKRISAKEAASRAIDLVIAHPRYFSFSIPSLDMRMGGIFPERLYIWAGYQGSGKSALKIQNCRRNAELGFKVLDISLEMSAEQTWLRMACGDLGVDFDSVLSGKIDTDTRTLVVDKAAELGEMYEKNLVIYPAPMSLMDIAAVAKMERPDIIWIDHSRLISGKPKDYSALDWATHIPTFLRQNVAKANNGISVHLLQQINRSSNKENRRPNMHDLKFAGEDDPDMVTLLYRPEANEEMNDLPFGQVKVEFICDKNRFGWTGTEDVIFNLPNQEFLPSHSTTTPLNPKPKKYTASPNNYTQRTYEEQESYG